MSRLKRFEEINQNINSIYEKELRTFGNSTVKTFKEYGPSVIPLRIEDSLHKLKHTIMEKLSGDFNDGDIINLLTIIALTAVDGIMLIEDTYQIEEVVQDLETDAVEDDTEEEGESIDLEKELQSYNKKELLLIAKMLKIKIEDGIKTKKDKMIELILEDTEDEKIEEALDNLD